MINKVFSVLVLINCVFSQSEEQTKDPLVIGGLFYKDEVADLEDAFRLVANELNFTHSVKVLPRGASYLTIQQQVCGLAEEKVIGIIDGLGGRATQHIQALCDALELPHVIVQPNDMYARNWSILSLYPSPDVYNNVLNELITDKGWNNFTILFEKGRSIRHVEGLFHMGNYTDKVTISLRELSGENYRYVLIDAKEKGYCNFVVDCTSERLEQLLAHAQQVGLMADEHSYIFLSPDLFTLDLSRYRYGGVNMTGLRLFDLKNSQMLWNFISKLTEETGRIFKAEDLKTKMILVHDAVRMFYESVNKVGTIVPESLECAKDQSWSYGSTLLSFMKTNKIEGITRNMVFDGLGQRTDVTFDILELTPSGNQTIGQWKSHKLEMNRPYVPIPDVPEDYIMRNKSFRVLIALTDPYAYEKKSSAKLEGNDRYEGFAIDIIKELSLMLGFDYEFAVLKDYGGRDKDDPKKWTGMVKELRDQTADFAICDLTITVERQQGIDFSTPFMTLGIGILYKEPSKQPPAMFSFMAVFTEEVWLYMVFVQLCIGVIMIFVGRISNKEWQNPVPCIEQPEELSNQFSFANSVWLIIGSVMQQGSEIAPIALAPRLITSVWWFFTMVMVASYVGTLVAFLTVEKNVLPFNNVDELYEQKSINYGCKKTGSTRQFFENPTSELYRKMRDKMNENPKMSYVEDNKAGVEKAESENYAFFTESTAIDFFRERHCDLLQIGELLDTKSYGIGMTPNSTYKRYIDDALLKLKESGRLEEIKNYWWKEDRGGGQCGQKKEEEAKQLGMKNMIGAFVVLGAGCLIGLVISILDMLWGVFKRSVKYKTTFKYELVEELKFALTFSGDVKPVKRPPKSSEGSDEALADPEAKEEDKDELGSLRSAKTVRSGRSTSSKKSAHSHCSRHSSSELSVAFARRRKF